MNPEPNQQTVLPPAPSPEAEGGQPTKPSGKRRGVVIVAVLIIVASLSLVGYHYSDLMVSEQKASEYAHRNAQAHAFAASGIYWAAAKLADPDSYANDLGANPFNNQVFVGVPVQGDGVQGYFSIYAPANLDDGSALTAPVPGVSDEGGKINLNTMMIIDSNGQQLHDMLVTLPNMTEDIANSIVAWLGGTVGTQNGGADDSYYQGQSPPYRCKNGPIDSLDELLLVRGITRDLLYGADANRNGFQDPTESGQTMFDRGWSAYLTVHSREQNCDPQTGKPYVFLNNTDLNGLYTDLGTATVNDDLAKFIIMYRQYGPASASTGKTQTLGGTIAALLGGGKTTTTSPNSNSSTMTGDLSGFQLDLTKKPGTNLTSLFDLIGASVSISKVDPDTKKTVTYLYASPLSDPSQLADQMATLAAVATFSDGPEVPARININTAPLAVLNALTAVTNLTSADIQNINTARTTAMGNGGAAQVSTSVAWLITDAQLNPTTLKSLTQYVTTRTQVYRVQSIGYFDGNKGSVARIEAIIDTNAGRPRIVAWRDLTELGKGMPQQ